MTTLALNEFRWYGKGTFVWKGLISSFANFYRQSTNLVVSTVHDEAQGSVIKIIYCVKNNNRKDKVADVGLVSLLLTDWTHWSDISIDDFKQGPAKWGPTKKVKTLQEQIYEHVSPNACFYAKSMFRCRIMFIPLKKCYLVTFYLLHARSTATHDMH